MISVFDLHCDTLLEVYNKGLNFESCCLHINLNKVRKFKNYAQVCAIWSDYRLDDLQAYQKAVSVINFYKNQGFSFITHFKNINKQSFILGIEDARILNGDISKLYLLYELGVRVVTLNWKGVSCIGGGFDTDIGLSDFGKDVVLECARLGIVIDLSHSSTNTFFDVINLGNRFGFTPIASHSNSLFVCNHKRNLSDEQFKCLCDLNSVIGISFATEHLGKSANLYTIISHVEHYLSLIGENAIALGCDFDGVNALPVGIESIDDLATLYSLFCKEFGKNITEKIFFHNANNYFMNF